MAFELTTAALTKRGVISHDELTTDDETLVREPDGSLIWTPITGISVVESTDFHVVITPGVLIRCSYDQRLWLARRIRSGYDTRELVDTLDNRRQQDRVIFSGHYLSGYTRRNLRMTTSEARVLGLLVAGHGSFTYEGGETHITLRRSSATPGWWIQDALADIRYRVYGDEYVIEPFKSARINRLFRQPAWKTIFDADALRREELLNAFFLTPPEEEPNMYIRLLAFLCGMRIEPGRLGSYVLMPGAALLQHATYGTMTGKGWKPVTEHGGWTAYHNGNFIALPA